MSDHYRSISRFLAIGASVLAISAPALAQESNSEASNLDTIVVTAQ